MKKGFTIIEVSILFVIFMIVAILVAPLSLDDTIQARNTSRWRNVQSDFNNIFYSVRTKMEDGQQDFKTAFFSVMDNEVTGSLKPYKITFFNGDDPSEAYTFKDYKTSFSKAVFSVKMFDEPDENNLQGYLMYDVNGASRPNVWGKDVFGFNIYPDKLEPFGQDKAFSEQRADCSKNGTGLSCSNYYLMGGNFD